MKNRILSTVIVYGVIGGMVSYELIQRYWAIIVGIILGLATWYWWDFFKVVWFGLFAYLVSISLVVVLLVIVGWVSSVTGYKIREFDIDEKIDDIQRGEMKP